MCAIYEPLRAQQPVSYFLQALRSRVSKIRSGHNIVEKQDVLERVFFTLLLVTGSVPGPCNYVLVDAPSLANEGRILVVTGDCRKSGTQSITATMSRMKCLSLSSTDTCFSFIMPRFDI